MASVPTPIITIKNLKASAGSTSLLNEANLSLLDNSRVGLVGTNGAGKSTLLKIIAGIEEHEDGQIVYRKGKTVEYVPQFVPKELVNVTLVDSYIQKINESSKHCEEWKAYEMLSLLKFHEDMYDTPLGSLSGGEANRALLGRALVCNPDFLLLDEPTNHMDSEAIIFFERLLEEELKIPFCMVSHDRDLLDTVTNETLFIRDHQVYHFRVPFSQATLELRAMDEAAREKRQLELNEIARLKASSERLRGWVKCNSNKAASLRSMVGRMEKIKDNLTFVSRGNDRDLGVDGAQLQIKKTMRIPKLSVHGGERFLYKIENVEFCPGDRAVILGPNGAGKTSLLKLISEAFTAGDSEGIKFNPQVTLGYYDQELKRFHQDATLFSHINDNTDAGTGKTITELVAAGFPFHRHNDKVKILSGGEKARLQFLTLKIKRPGLLLLDEPTNHIDVQGIEDLENELLDFPGTCIFVSHDRRFVNTVANRFFLINKGKLQEIGDVQPYYQLLADKSMEEAKSPEKSSTKDKQVSTSSKTFEELSLEIETLEKLYREQLDLDTKKQINKLYKEMEKLL